jgi:hypothetical protein
MHAGLEFYVRLLSLVNLALRQGLVEVQALTRLLLLSLPRLSLNLWCLVRDW